MDHTEQIKRLKENIGSVLGGKQKTHVASHGVLEEATCFLRMFRERGKQCLPRRCAVGAGKDHRFKFTTGLAAVSICLD